MSYEVGFDCKKWTQEENDKFKSKGIDLGQHVHYSYVGEGVQLYFGIQCSKKYEVDDIKVPKFDTPS